MFDYDSTLFLGNAGFGLWIVWAHFVLLIVFLLTYRVRFLRKHLGNYLLWNTLIRLFCEIYFEMLLLAALNLHTVDWDSPFSSVMVSNIFSIFVLIAVIVAQITIMYMYFRKRESWSDENFQSKYGSLLDGTKVKSKTIS